ncbi:MAG TPA: ATP-binding protein [Polyangiaceae bacterium]
MSEVTNRGGGALPQGSEGVRGASERPENRAPPVGGRDDSDDRDDVRTAITAAGMCAWQWDIATGAVSWSPGLEALFEMPPGSFGGSFEAYQAAILPEERDRIQAAIERALRGETASYSIEHRVHGNADGDRWLATRGNVFRDADGKPLRMAGVVWDITPQKRLEQRHTRERAEREAQQREAAEALRASEERYRTLFEQAFEGIFLVGRAPEYRIVDANESACRMLGYPRADLQTMTAGQIVESSDLSVAPLRFDAIPMNGMILSERRMLRRDGTIIEVEVSTKAFEDGHYRCVLNDVTERRRAQGQLLLADRLTSIGRLASGVAHEVNNPLAYVMLNLELLQRKLAALPEEAREAVGDVPAVMRDVLGGVDRVRRIVRLLSAFGRGDEERIEPVDVNGALESACEIAAIQLRHHARIVHDYQANALASANSFRLGQVFLNLLVNAADAVGEGGESNEIELRTYLDAGGRVVVEVEDHGIGIPKAIQARIFDPFFTTKAVGKGSGLGLSVCHAIVTSFGGEITCASEPGKGSTFRVSLPAASRVMGPMAERAVRPHAPPPAARRGRVLVVDDDPHVASAVAHALDEHDVVIATGGREALAKCRSQPFDCIVCDLMMPDTSGLDVVEALRQEGSGLERRVLLLTGGAVTESARASVASLPNVVLEKPVEMRRLREEVTRIVGPRVVFDHL